MGAGLGNSWKWFVGAPIVAVAASPAAAEVVRSDPPLLETSPSNLASSLIKLDENLTPLFGYSLEFRATPRVDATGSVTAEAVITNFFDSENIITAAGAVRDPLFSVINLDADDDLFVSTNTDDGSTVLAEMSVNDVLAEIVFQASADANGVFDVTLESNSALSDGAGQPVAFSFEPFAIAVSPCPGDSNGSGFVDFGDLTLALENWLQSVCSAGQGQCMVDGGQGDANGDGAVNFGDVTSVLNNWLSACAAFDSHPRASDDLESGSRSNTLGDAVTDLNADGQINVLDVAILKQAVHAPIGRSLDELKKGITE